MDGGIGGWVGGGWMDRCMHGWIGRQMDDWMFTVKSLPRIAVKQEGAGRKIWIVPSLAMCNRQILGHWQHHPHA